MYLAKCVYLQKCAHGSMSLNASFQLHNKPAMVSGSFHLTKAVLI